MGAGDLAAFWRERVNLGRCRGIREECAARPSDVPEPSGCPREQFVVAEHIEEMRCMEVWGGNEPADRGVSMAGLDAVVYSAPVGAGASGGDVHYLSSCATGRITRILVADVSGHGDTVANTARSLRDLMRRFINFVDQTRLVEGLNRAFSDPVHGGLFATAVVATYWAPTGTLVVCNAGHPRPLIYRARARRWSVLTGESGGDAESNGAVSDIPLGIDADGAYTQFQVRLERGDLVVFYTDAIIEARSPSGQLLGERGLLEIMESMRGATSASTPTALTSAVLEEVAKFRGGAASEDDTTMLVLTPNDAVPRAGLWQGIVASGRIVRAALSTVVSGRGSLPLPQMRADVIGGAVVGRLNKGRSRSR
jgi:sigma-B regulation protein RsbU (phosphoserine phosphatase)